MRTRAERSPYDSEKVAFPDSFEPALRRGAPDVDVDFAEWGEGQCGWMLKATHEYHYIPPDNLPTEWVEVEQFPMVRTGGYGWRLVDEDGRRVLEETVTHHYGMPLVVGPRTGESFHLEVEVKLVEEQCPEPVGVVFAYKHDLTYYTFYYDTDGAVKLAVRTGQHVLHSQNVKVTWANLALKPLVLKFGRYYTFSVEKSGSTITCLVDGEPVFTVEDDHLDAGRIGMLANSKARFRALRLWGAKAAGRPPKSANSLKLWRRLDTKGFGTYAFLRFADLDGDGKNEILVTRPINRSGKRRLFHPGLLTAMNLDGETLWQAGEPCEDLGPIATDLPVQAVDMDGQGYADAIFARDAEVVFVDGRTGKEKNIIEMPPAPYMERSFDVPEADAERAWVFQILTCNMFDRERMNMVVKDFHNHVWAYRGDGSLAWARPANTGHYCVAATLGDDELESLIAGYAAFSPEGDILWHLPLTDHQDALCVLPRGVAGDARIAMAAGEEGLLFLDDRGRILSETLVGHAQRLTIGRYMPGNDQPVICITSFWGTPGVVSVFDMAGKLLTQWDLPHPCSAVQPVTWGDGSKELILVSPALDRGGFFDGTGERVALFPDDGHPVTCYNSIDIDGDGVDEVLAWDAESIWIYKQSEGKPPERPVLRSTLHNASNYRGEYRLAT